MFLKEGGGGQLRGRTPRSRASIKSCSALFIFWYLSFIICFYFISFLYFFLFTHPTFHPLVAWLLETLQGPQREHHPLLPFSTHKGSEKNSYSIFLLFFLLFPFAPRLFPCCLLWFQNVFSLHEILLILFSLAFSFVGLTFKKNGWKKLHFSHQICTSFISCSHAFHFLTHGKTKKKENVSYRGANRAVFRSDVYRNSYLP